MCTHLEQYVDDEDVEHILEGVDDAVEHSLEFGHPLDSLERPEHAEHAKGLDRAQVLAGGAAPVSQFGKARINAREINCSTYF